MVMFTFAPASRTALSTSASPRRGLRIFESVALAWDEVGTAENDAGGAIELNDGEDGREREGLDGFG